MQCATFTNVYWDLNITRCSAIAERPCCRVRYRWKNAK